MNVKKVLWLWILLTFCGLLYAQMDNETCMECHSDPELTRVVNDTVEVSLFVDSAHLQGSVHADFQCTDCHAVGEDHPDDVPLGEPTCANCHEDVYEEYEQSIHGLGRKQGIQIAATCWDCHGTHNIRSAVDSSSKVYGKNLLKTCASCHSNTEVMRQFGHKRMDPVELYAESVHGRIFAEDPEANVASCITCHGSHDIKPAIDPNSNLSELNIPETCGTCHDAEAEEYTQSIHWISLKRGHHESPNCTDCHGEHNIQSYTNGSPFEHPELEATKVCAGCHSSERLMERFGLDYRRFESYFRTYHGLAVLKGSPRAATCTSCHETHSIRDSHDTLATTNPKNLVNTCGQCHSNVTPEFAQIEVHPIGLKDRNYIAYLLRAFYKWMIFIVIGGMILHNLLIVVYHIRQKRRAKKYSELVPRFQTFEVYQHLLLILSFGTLVVTGFALKFPDAYWVRALYGMGMDEVIRSTLHRIAAIIMLVISLIQAGYFIFSRKGREEIMALMPTRKDLTDFWQNMKFHLGLSKEKPKFDHFDYTEKAEYLALIWGVIIMGATGFMLWFPEFFARFLPNWFFEAAEIVHYYEAWLASLAILVWHWFFVIYHPDVYPMNVTWVDGKISLEELKHHHPLEYERIIKERKEKYDKKAIKKNDS
ncbi:cytochrome b/b6 domain-containing protein [Calditrichota bacterium GD2]